MAKTLAMPLTVVPGLGLHTLTQDSDAEVAQSVALLLSTRPGERRMLPDYGLPNPLGSGVDVDEVADVIEEWEDRADPADVDLTLTGVLDAASVRPRSQSQLDDTDGDL